MQLLHASSTKPTKSRNDSPMKNVLGTYGPKNSPIIATCVKWLMQCTPNLASMQQKQYNNSHKMNYWMHLTTWKLQWHPKMMWRKHNWQSSKPNKAPLNASLTKTYNSLKSLMSFHIATPWTHHPLQQNQLSGTNGKETNIAHSMNIKSKWVTPVQHADKQMMATNMMQLGAPWEACKRIRAGTLIDSLHQGSCIVTLTLLNCH